MSPGGKTREPILRDLFLFCIFEKGSYYVAEVGLELAILLPQPPEFQDY
jgi:hypothetical protein